MLIVFDLDDTLYDSTGYGSKEESGVLDISLFDGASNLLEDVRFEKILVTRGKPSLQNAKIDALNIRSYFKKIFIPPTDDEKEKYFSEIFSVHNPRSTIVIGNRIDCELRYGKIMGAKTVLFKHGKYKRLQPKDSFEIPDHMIDSFSEFQKILSKYADDKPKR